MSLSEEERNIIVGLEYEKALSTIDKVREYQALSHWDTVANRLYYALFHAVNALLISDGHTVNTHRGVISVFGNNICVQAYSHQKPVASIPTYRLFATIVIIIVRSTRQRKRLVH